MNSPNEIPAAVVATDGRNEIQFDVAVVIGRFMPAHNAHFELFRHALKIGKKVVVVLGSAFHARTAKNPFTWEERAAIISTGLTEDDRARVTFLPVRDYFDNNVWADVVKAKVRSGHAAAKSVVLVGYHKDASSDYLDLFGPDWQFASLENFKDLAATTIRRILFEAEDLDASLAVINPMVPMGVRQYLKAWTCLPCYSHLAAEHRKVEMDKKRYPFSPYVTADSVVTTNDHVLLIKRKHHPGKDLWAVPGGFLEPERRECLFQCAVRELTEETGLAVLPSSLRLAFQRAVVFDHTDRSVRGPTITHAHFFALKIGSQPTIVAGDDAANAEWVPIAKLASMEDQFFDDHFHILNYFLDLVRSD